MEAYGLRVGSESGSRSCSRSRGTYSSNSKYLEPTLELAKPVVSFNMSCAGPKYWRNWLLVGDEDDGRGAARSTPLPSLGRNLLGQLHKPLWRCRTLIGHVRTALTFRRKRETRPSEKVHIIL